jgi:simple sugar transport system ATP-binding protein
MPLDTQLARPPVQPSPAIEVDHVSKRFGATLALNDVSLTVARGSSHALVGRNGAGKSTLVGSLTGLVKPDSGSIRIASAGSATVGNRDNHRVACVYQRPQTLPYLTVAENLAIGVDRSRFINWKARRQNAAAILEEWQVPARPDDPAGSLDVEQRQLLEIARALSRGSEVVLLDEPTSQLDRRASQRLFEHIRVLQAKGITFVFISHHLDEVFEICDTATVLRDGCAIGTYPTTELTPASLVDLMVGEVEGAAPERTETDNSPPDLDGRVVLSAVGLSWPDAFSGVDLQVRSGEILALTGLAGSGSVLVAESLVGLHPRTGTVTVGDSPVPPLDVLAGQRAGIGFVPEDRHKEGFVDGLSITENLAMAVMPKLSRYGWLSRRRRSDLVDSLVDDLHIVPRDPSYPVGSLSGGNQQKVVMGRALASDPDLLVLIAPTAGVDVASKAALYARIRRSAEAGTAVLLVSDEIDEVDLADRVCVMFSGQLTAEFTAPWDERKLIGTIEGVTEDPEVSANSERPTT